MNPMDGLHLESPAPLPAPDAATMAVFRRLLVNTLVTGVTSSFLWFALTFWVYLETRSVVATGVIGGAFSISSALPRPVLRHLRRPPPQARGDGAVARHAVDRLLRRRHRRVRSPSTPTTCSGSRNPWFWVLVATTLLGSVAGQMRGIALSTCVTLLVPEDAPGPGQRHGRHRHRRLVRHHVGVQRPRHRPARHGLGLLRLARCSPLWPLVHLRTIHDRRARAGAHRPADGADARRRPGRRSTPSAPCPG